MNEQDSAALAAWIAAIASVLGLFVSLLIGTGQGRNLACDYASVLCPARDERFMLGYVDYLGADHKSPPPDIVDDPLDAVRQLGTVTAWESLRTGLMLLPPTVQPADCTDPSSCIEGEQLSTLATAKDGLLHSGNNSWSLRLLETAPSASLTQARTRAGADEEATERSGFFELVARYRPLARDERLTVALYVAIGPWRAAWYEAKYSVALRKASSDLDVLCPLPVFDPGDYELQFQTWGDLGDRDPVSLPIRLHVDRAPDPQGWPPQVRPPGASDDSL
jgi:hypothetical protein